MKQLVAAKKLSVNSQRYLNAKYAFDLATANVTAANAQLKKMQTDLDTAKANAEKTQAVKDARKKADATANVAQQAEVAYKTAQEMADKAKTAQEEADKNVADLKEIEAKWAKAKAETVTHEEGHRRICHYYADKLTDMLNKLRALGYAPKKDAAEKLGKAKFIKVHKEKVMAILKAEMDMQEKYDKDTDHGKKQNQWNWNNLK